VSPPREPPSPVIPGSFSGITSVERLADTDTLVFEGERLIVRCPREMPSWHVGTNRRTAVHFRGTRYVVVGAGTAQGQFEYRLEPWTPAANELRARDITYDERYVREREEDARAVVAGGREALALAPLWPALGFLPSSWKKGLHARYGFNPVAMTRFSVWLELVVLGVLFPSVALGLAGALQLCVFVALLVDGVVRGSILVEDEYPPFGFAEWAVHKRLAAVLRMGWDAVRARIRSKRSGD
jgi:hypothetical protein